MNFFKRFFKNKTEAKKNQIRANEIDDDYNDNDNSNDDANDGGDGGGE